MSALAAVPSPLDLFGLPYMRTALLEVALVAVTGGLLGAWIVLRRLAFFAHATGTATFPGLVVADATGLSATVSGLAVALGFATGVERTSRGRRDPGNTSTALVLVFALALGIVLASDIYESSGAVDRLLFGSALGLGGEDLWTAVAAAALAGLATAILGRAWTAMAFDPAAVSAAGLPARSIDRALLALVALAVVAALPAVGALLVTSMFVVPAATARLLSRTVRGLLATAVAVALTQGAVGLYVSLWQDVPPGPAIAVAGTVLYLVVTTASALRTAGGRPIVVEAT